MSSIIINLLTIIFVLIIIFYSLFNIIINKNLYNHISSDYKNIQDHSQRSLVYKKVKDKYFLYLVDNPNADVNITTFVEEICSNLKFKDKNILDKIKNIKNSSSNCILIGVLGTFVGLSLMLLNINTSDIINSLPKTISSMQTAFITSIFGIICSIALNFILSNNDCEQMLTRLMLKYENLLTSDITNKKSIELENKIQDLKNTIKQISKSIESIEKFDDISRDLNKFNEQFIHSIKTLENLLLGAQDSIKVFDRDIRKLDNQFNILNIKFTKLFDKFESQEDINKEILLDIKQTSKNIIESTDNQYKMKDYLRNLSANFSLYERSAQDLLIKLIDYEKRLILLEKDVNNEQINLDDTIKHLASIISISSQDIDEKLNMIFDYIDIYKEAVARDNMKDKKNNKRKVQEDIYDLEKYESSLKEFEDSVYNENQNQTGIVRRKRKYPKSNSIESINDKVNALNNSSSTKLIGDDFND